MFTNFDNPKREYTVTIKADYTVRVKAASEEAAKEEALICLAEEREYDVYIYPLDDDDREEYQTEYFAEHWKTSLNELTIRGNE